MKYKCVNHWNEMSDLDGYCRGTPEFVAPPNEEEIKTGRIQQKCKLNPMECLNYMSWNDICEQNRGNILHLEDLKNKKSQRVTR